MSIESSELLECFQWKSLDEVKQSIVNEASEEVKYEIADIGIYFMLLCEATSVDLENAILIS